MDYESLYVAETKDVKPDVKDYNFKTQNNRAEMFRSDLLAWQVRFSKWLSARLDKREMELNVIRKLIDKGEIEVLQDFHGNPK